MTFKKKLKSIVQTYPIANKHGAREVPAVS